MPKGRVLDRNSCGIVVRDGFPVVDGHTLVIASRHVCSFFDLTADEQSGLLDLIREAKRDLERTLHPDGYNIGINDGAAAGQTVPHLHIHVIPRFHGDCVDPRGGIRWLFPDRADYWSGV